MLKIDYDYGTATQNNGSLREQKINYNGLSSEIKQTYAYDDLNRVQSATETFNTGTQAWKQTFSYDRFGNRRFDAANTSTLGQNYNQNIANPLINTSDNRISNGQGYGYDKSGNLTQDAEGKRYFYDAENHQTSYFATGNSSITPDAIYEYDGNGTRVRKIVGQVETIFVYNAMGQTVAEYSNQLPVEKKVSYLTADHLGSPRIVTDQGGQVVSRHDYMAFGDEVSAGIANRTTAQKYGAFDEIRQQYTGYQRDTESGLDFAQARYYNSKQGRFTSVDPLTASANVKDPQTFNRYSYAMNSPYKFTDPLGLIAQGTGSNSGFCGAENSSCDGDGESTTSSETDTRVANIAIGTFNQPSSEQQRLFVSYVESEVPEDEYSNCLTPTQRAEAYWNSSAEAANRGSQDPNDPTLLLDQSQLTTFIGVTSMWEKTGVSGKIANVTEIRGDVKNHNFALIGTFVKGGGEFIRSNWKNIPGETEEPYNTSRREKGVYSQPNGQFKITDDNTGFQSDVDYNKTLIFPVIPNPRHNTHDNSDIRKAVHLQRHIKDYGSVPIIRVN